jgi:CubicO group peptidase (beta-lactamase class C family)
LDENVKELMSEFQVPGLALAIVKDGSIILSKGYGEQEIGKSEKVDKNTAFPIASVSKSTTALCLAILVEEKKLDWDDKVIKYLPDFKMYDEWVTNEITIRDLLTHRSGLPSISGGTLWFGSDFSREEIVSRIKYLKPVSSFRSKYAYQNIMYLVAGQIIKVVSGKTWDEFVKERIFNSLGMHNSGTTYEDLINFLNTAKPHIIKDDKIQSINFRNHDNIGPAASVVASATDMAKYLLLYLNEGKSGSKQLINKFQLKELITPQMTLPFSTFSEGMEYANPTYLAYGLGWFIKDYVGYKIIYHSVGVDGFRCLVTMIPDKQLGFVVLTNQEERGMTKALTSSLVDAYLGFPELGWKNYFLKISEESTEKRKEKIEIENQKRVVGTKSTFSLEKYYGIYRDEMYGDISVGTESGKLILSFSHTPAFTAELNHWHFDTFKLKWHDPIMPDGLCTFVLDSNKKISELKLDQPDLLDVDFSELKLIRVNSQ